VNDVLPVTLVRVAAAGDSALVAEFPGRIDPEINDRAAALAQRLRWRWGGILRDVVVGYCTVTVYFDPLQVDAPWLESEIQAAAGPARQATRTDRAVVDVPVCYEGDLAPDLHDVARFGGCSPDEVVALHTNRTYRVYMLGFIPGFAYLAEVDPRIAAPRRAAPRTEVPAGAVAIAGGQTGIYPAVTPGGWNIIGRTRKKPYDPGRPVPFLFGVGDEVRFRPVSRAEFEQQDTE
jgi:KipI family sensor histidine kinase inhibitor